MEKQVFDDEIDLRAYLSVVRERWRTVVLAVVIALTAAYFYSQTQKPMFEAKATFLIRSGGGGGFSQLSGLAGINLSAGAGGNISDMTVLLQSGAVASRVAEELDLRRRVKDWDDPKLREDQIAAAVKSMLGKPKVDGNLIEIKVKDQSPQLAADVANGYLEALLYYWNILNYTEARKKREYIESQLPIIQRNLLSAEQNMKQFTLLSPKGGVGVDSAGSGLLGASSGVEIARLNRELEIQTAVYTMLRNQYEQVKLEESKEIPPFAVIDRAVKPLSSNKPEVRINLMFGAVLGLFLGLFSAFLQEYWDKSGRIKRS